MSDLIVEPMPPAELQPAARRDPWARLTRGFSGFAAVGLLVLAAALGGLISGGFAFTLATARVATVLLLAMLAVNGTSGVVKGLISRRRGGRPHLVVRPVHIVLLVVIALFTQWIGIGAVVLFGLLMVVPDDSEAADPFEPATDDRRLGALAVMFGAGWALVLAVAAVIGTAFIAQHPFTDLIVWGQIDASRAPELQTAMDLATILALEFCMVVLVITLGSLPLLLLPLRGFEGRLLWEWSPIAWAIGYVVVIAAAGILLLPLVQARSAWLWAIPFAVYAVAMLIAGLLRRPVALTEGQVAQPT